MLYRNTNVARFSWLLAAVALWITALVSLADADADATVDALKSEGIRQSKEGMRAAAVDSYGKAIRLSESALPADHVRRGTLHSGCAYLLEKLNRHNEVPAAFEQAIKSYGAAATPPSNEPDITRLKYVRYLIRREQFRSAEKILKPLLVTRSDSDQMRARALTTLGELQVRTYRWDEAYRTLTDAINQSEDAFEPRHTAIASAHNTMGQLLYRLGAGKEAEEHLLEAIAVYRARKNPADPDLINARINLVKAYLRKRDFDAAVEKAKEALRGAEQAGSTALLARAQSALAKAYLESGEQFGPAAEFYQKAITTDSDHPAFTPLQRATLDNNLGISQLLCGDLDTAAETIRKTVNHLPSLGEGPGTTEQRFSIHFNHAMLLHHQGKPAAAAGAARQAVAALEQNHRDVLAFFPPELRQSYAQDLVRYPFHLAGTLQNPRLALEFVLHHKGIVTESIARDRAQIARLRDSGGPEVEKAKELESLQQKFATATLGNQNTSELRKSIRQLHSDLLDPEPDLTELDPDKLMTTLAEGEVVIDFFEFRNNRAGNGWRWDMGALVLRRGAPPKFYSIPQGKLEQLETHVNELRQRIAEPDSFAYKGADARKWGELVFEIVLGSARDEIATCKILTISPDGCLHHVPFPILRDRGGRELVMTRTIRQINSLRDLLRPTTTPPVAAERRALLVGDPDYDADYDADLIPGDDPFRFKSIPGTAEEINQTATILKASHAAVQILDRATAKESSFRASTGGKTVIHLATHGYYYERNSEEARTLRLNRVADPMLRGGLALAGANRTCRAWTNQQIPDTNDDGMLTAAEIARLDLRQANLVVLSACDTALGEAASGQGIQGIRRALGEAGCPHVLTTLWEIPDRGTILLMRAFYANYLAGQSPAVAMSAAQRKLLAAPSKSPWKTIKAATPFVVTSLGH